MASGNLRECDRRNNRKSLGPTALPDSMGRIATSCYRPRGKVLSREARWMMGRLGRRRVGAWYRQESRGHHRKIAQMGSARGSASRRWGSGRSNRKGCSWNSVARDGAEAPVVWQVRHWSSTRTVSKKAHASARGGHLVAVGMSCWIAWVIWTHLGRRLQ